MTAQVAAKPAAPPRAALIGFDTVLKQAVLLFAVFIALVPTIFMIMTAFKSDEEYTFNKVGLPHALVFDHFNVVLFESEFFHWMLNSAILAGGSVLLSTVVSCLGAYAFERIEF
jgi:ABC-type glycerol-3-phosphate transport system permease component